MPANLSSLRIASAHYRALLKKIAFFETRLRSRHAASIQCRPGCAECCTLSSVFPVEAQALSAALNKLPIRVLGALTENKGDHKVCPLLLDGRCTVYAARPVICRTHGYPLRVNGRVDFCGLNFKGVRSFDAEDVLDLDALNTVLAVVNIVFWKATDGEHGRNARVPLKRLLAQAIQQRRSGHKRKKHARG
ncbi:MAG: YkgJ family cysteine cluster protein [Fibrobacterota bacterium]